MRRSMRFFYSQLAKKTPSNLPKQTYLIYDTETTGLNPVFDQILQFCAIRTTFDFKELKRYSVKIQLRKDLIPHPGALAVNEIADFNEGETEYTAAKKIHGIKNEPGTISFGYNSQQFDDKIIRHAFYRNLLDPYTHQYANHCGRMDILPIVAAYHLFKPEMLSWPTKPNGKVFFKLAALNETNGLIPQAKAHDAMSDTEVTLALAKHLSQEKKLWSDLTARFDKKTDKALVEKILCYEKGGYQYKTGFLLPAIHRDPKNPIPVIILGDSIVNPSRMLAIDVSDFAFGNPDLRDAKIINKKYGEAPILIAGNFSNDMPRCFEAAIDWINNHRAEFEAIRDTALSKNYYDFPKNTKTDPYGQLYQLPFPTPKEKKLFVAFHQAAPQHKMRVANTFPQKTCRELALRITGNHFSEHLSVAEQMEFDEHLHRVYAPLEDKIPVGFDDEPQLSVNKAIDAALESVKAVEMFALWFGQPHVQRNVGSSAAFFRHQKNEGNNTTNPSCARSP